MKAMVLERTGPIEERPLVLRDVPTPQPQAGEIRIRVTACGVCHTELDEIEGRLEAGLPVIYESIVLNVGFRCDFLVDGRVIVECKAVKALSTLDEAQLLNYLKTAHLSVGLLFNFHVLRMKEGIRRMVNNFSE